MQSMIVRIGADISGLSRSLSQASSQISGFGNRMSSQGKAIATTFGAASVAVGGGLLYAVKQAAGFERAMSEVKAITGASGSDFDKLSDKAREMGSKTSKSASEAAEAMKYMGLAGWDTSQIMGGIEPVLRLSEAGNLDLARASDLVTDSMAALGIEVKDLPGYLDKVAQASRKSNTDIDALMEAFLVTGGTFRSFNVPLDEATAMLGILANRGYKGAEAGTAMNAIITNLTSGAGQAGKAMKELGLSAFDSEGKFKGLEAVLLEVKKKTEGMTDEQKAQYISMIAGKEHLKTFQALLNGLGEEYGDLKGDINDSKGALNEMSDEMQNNLIGQITKLMSAVAELAISLGNQLLPYIKLAVGFVNDLIDRFNGLSDETKQFIAVAGGISFLFTSIIAAGGLFMAFVGSAAQGLSMLTSGFGKVIGVFGRFIPPLSNVSSLFGVLRTAVSALFGPVGLIIAAVTALVAVFVHMYQTNEEFREKVNVIWESIKEVITTAMSTIGEFIMDVWTQIQEFWTENGEMILQAAQNVWETIQTVISTVMDVIMAIMTALWPIIEMLVISTWEAIKGAVKGAVDVIMGIIKLFSSLFTGDWTTLWEAIKQILSGAVQFVWNFINLMFIGKVLKGVKAFGVAFKNLFTSIWTGVKTLTMTIWNGIRAFLSGIWNGIKGTGTSIFNAIRGVISTVWNVIKSISLAVWNAIRGSLSGIWNGLKAVVSTVFNAIKTLISTVWNAVRSISTSIWNGIKGTLTGIWNGFKSAVSTAFNAVKSTIQSIWSGIMSFFRGIDLTSIGKNIIQGLINGVGSMAGALYDKMTSIVSNAVDGVMSFLGIASPSRFFKEIGEYTWEGFMIGANSMKNNVSRQSLKMARAAVPDMGSVGMPGIGIGEPSVAAAASGAPYASPSQVVGIFQFNGREFARMVTDAITEEQQMRVHRASRARGVR